MDGENVRRVYIDSPIFTREDEENFCYVQTDIDLDSSRRANHEEAELQSVIKEALGPPLSPSNPDTGGPAYHEQISPELRDSLEDHPGGTEPRRISNNRSQNNNRNSLRIDPERYEDVGVKIEMGFYGGENQPSQVRFRENPREIPPHPHMNDDAEEYAEARLERARQRRLARRAHVPHLDLIDSEDEHGPEPGAPLDLEFDDGRVPHGAICYPPEYPPRGEELDYPDPPQQWDDGRWQDGRTVQDYAYPDDEFYVDDVDAQDSLEVAQYRPPVGGDRGNPDYGRELRYANSRPNREEVVQEVVHDPRSRQAPRPAPSADYQRDELPPNAADRRPYREAAPPRQNQNNSGASAAFTTAQVPPSRPANNNPPVRDSQKVENTNKEILESGNPPLRTSNSRFPSAQQPENPVSDGESQRSPPSNVSPRQISDRDNASMASSRGPATDFVEVNKVVRKPTRTYGQIFIRKKEKENLPDSSVPAPRQNRQPRKDQVGKTADEPRRREENEDGKTRKMEKEEVGRGGGEGNGGVLSAQNSFTDTGDEVPTAEQLWQARSRSLAARKESSEPALRNNHQRGGSVQPVKYRGGDVANDSRLSVASAPGGYQRENQPREKPLPRVATRPPPQERATPQKVSVDINLNVISPRQSLGQPSSNAQFQVTANTPADYGQNRGYQLTPHGHAYDPVPVHYQYSLPPAHPSQNAVSPQHYPHPMMPPGADYGSFPVVQYPYPPAEMYFSNTSAGQPAMQGQASALPVRYAYNFPQGIVVNVSPRHMGYGMPFQAQQAPVAAFYAGDQSNSGGNMSAPHPMSPYRVLPPVVGASSSAKERPSNRTANQSAPLSPTGIGSGLTNGGGSASGGSYMEQYRRQKKRPDYKTYTVDDYRKLKKEMKLNMGALGPDMENETLRERKEKVARQQEYAQLIRERNKMEIQQKAPLKPRELSTQDENEDLMNRRRLALEYAKHVPKPKVRHNSAGDSYRQDQLAPLQSESDVAIEELQRLQQRHQWEREQVARLLQGRGLPT